MKKKDLLLPVLSTLLLSPVILAQQVQADEVQTADTSSTIVQQTETTGTSASFSNSYSVKIKNSGSPVSMYN